MPLTVLGFLLLAMAFDQAKSRTQLRDPYCFRPLEEFCARDKCLTYAAQLETIKAGGYSAQVEMMKAAGGDCTQAQRAFLSEVQRAGAFVEHLARRRQRDTGARRERRFEDVGYEVIA